MVGQVDLSRDYRAAFAVFGHRLKELRPGTMRVLFVFDSNRVPVLLYGGDKAGDWKRWYVKAIKNATRSYRDYMEG